MKNYFNIFEHYETPEIAGFSFSEMLALKNDNWLFNDANSDLITNKVRAKGFPISEISDIEIKRGLTTGFDDAFLINKEKYVSLTIDIESNKSIIKKALKGENINRYKINYNDLWLINSHNGIKGFLEPIYVERDFPQVYQHLYNINIKTNGKVENRSDKGKHWTNLRSCAFLSDFEKPKIVWGLISGNWDFAYDNVGYFLTSASFFLTSKQTDLKFILALLNSTLYRYYFIQIGEYTAGGAYVLKKTTIEKFIIPSIDEEVKQAIIEKVDKVLELKQKGEDTLILESDIDNMVYAIFDISKDDQKVIKEQLNG